MVVESERFGVCGEDVFSGQRRLVGVKLSGVFGRVLHHSSRVFKYAVECAGDERVCVEEADLPIRRQVEEM